MGPDPGPHRGPDDDQQLPEPDGSEDGPVAPLNDPVQPQSQQHREEQQARVDQELTAAATETHGKSSNTSGLTARGHNT